MSGDYIETCHLICYDHGVNKSGRFEFPVLVTKKVLVVKYRVGVGGYCDGKV